MPIVVSVGENAGWLGLSIELWSGIIGAVLGAVASGVISLLLQNQAYKRHSADAAAQRHLERRVVALSILTRLMSVDSNVVNLRAYLLDQSEGVIRTPGHPMLWARVRALPSLPGEVHFTNEERALVFSLGDEALFAGLMSLEPHHNSIIGALTAYPAIRASLNNLPVTEIRGGVGVLDPDAAEFHAAIPRMTEGNTLLEGVWDSLDRLASEAQQLPPNFLARAKTAHLFDEATVLRDDPEVARARL